MKVDLVPIAPANTPATAALEAPSWADFQREMEAVLQRDPAMAPLFDAWIRGPNPARFPLLTKNFLKIARTSLGFLLLLLGGQWGHTTFPHSTRTSA